MLTLGLARSTRRSRRCLRGLAALAALMLVASNALAAMGLCVAKTPVQAPAATEQLVAMTPCGHPVVDDVPVAPQTAGPTHCPQDDPGAQVRGGEAAGDLSLAAPPAFFGVVHIAEASPVALRVDTSPPTPLYARLARLRL
jgi:hypothetical protein